MKITEKERLKWCYSFKAGKRWLNAIKVDKSGSKHTEREYTRAIYTYCQWIGKNPDQLIAERKLELKNEDTKKNAEDKVREFCVMLQNTRDITRSTIATKYHAPIKSFYNYNDVPLKLRTPKYVMRRREPHRTEEIKELMKIADVRERAIIMFLKDSGMSREDAVQLTYGDIKTELESDQQVIHIKAVRIKQAIQYDTFIGFNAIECLKAYLKSRRSQEQITEDSPLLATLSGKRLTPEALSLIFIRLGKKVGFKTSPHRFRKYFESHLGLTAPSMLVNYWLGHSLGVESSYFIPPVEKQREKYREAYTEIDLYPQERTETQYQVWRAEILARTEGMTTDQRKRLTEEIIKTQPFNIQKMLKDDPLIEELLKGKTENEDCQHIIRESELSMWLARGFRVAAVLPSGKIVVSNE